MRWWWSTKNLDAEFDDLFVRLEEIRRKVDTMATRADLDAAKQQLSAEIDLVVQHINDLDTQLKSGQPITQADIDDLKADLAKLQGTDVQPQPAPTPPVP